MSQKMLTKIALLTMGITAVVSHANAQEKSSAQLYSQFETSLKTKVPEDSLLKLRMSYLQLNQRRSANDSLDKEIIAVYPKGQTAAMAQIVQDFQKIKAETYTVQDFDNLKTEFPNVNFDDKNSGAGSYYAVLKSAASPIFI